MLVEEQEKLQNPYYGAPCKALRSTSGRRAWHPDNLFSIQFCTAHVARCLAELFVVRLQWEYL